MQYAASAVAMGKIAAINAKKARAITVGLRFMAREYGASMSSRDVNAERKL